MHPIDIYNVFRLPIFVFSPYTNTMSRVRRSSEVIVMLCSFPTDVRAWIKEQAARNLSPMNSVIVAAVRREMDAERQQQVGEGH